MTAQTIAILDLLHHGDHPPAPAPPDHDRQMADWVQRFLARLDAALRLLGALTRLEGEEPCPPSS